jgi:hypothetical protein
MQNFSRRIARLENKLWVKFGPYPHIIVTNLPGGDECCTELAPGVYLDVIGRPLTPEEYEQLRVDWEKRHPLNDKS